MCKYNWKVKKNADIEKLPITWLDKEDIDGFTVWRDSYINAIMLRGCNWYEEMMGKAQETL